MIRPVGDVDAEAFWSGLDHGILLVSTCGTCAHRWLPPLPTCPRCGARDVGTASAATGGALYSWTVIHMAADPAYAAETPYNVGLVELDDGARLYGRITGVDRRELRDGLRLSVRVTRLEDQPIWEFVPE